MGPKTKEVVVGIFVVVGIVVVCGMVLHFGKFQERLQKMYNFDVRFTNVGQIARGAPVIASGVTVGKVRDIILEREGRVRLTLAIWEGITIRNDARFTIKQAGLLGDLNVVVIPQSDSAPALRSGDLVEGVNPTDIQDTLEQAAQIVVKAKTAADNIENATRKLDQNVMSEETLTNLRVAISNISIVSANADKLLTEARGLVGKVHNGIDVTVSNLETASANLNQFSTNLAMASAKTLDIVNTNENDIRSAVQNIKASSEHLNTMLTNVESGQGTVGKLLTDESFHQELKRLIVNLRRFGILRYRDEPLSDEPPKAPVPPSRTKP